MLSLSACAAPLPQRALALRADQALLLHLELPPPRPRPRPRRLVLGQALAAALRLSTQSAAMQGKSLTATVPMHQLVQRVQQQLLLLVVAQVQVQARVAALLPLRPLQGHLQPLLRWRP